MNTQISILVKNESILSRVMSFMWFINIFKKMSVNVWIDNHGGEPKVLKANSEPYVFDVTPGYHRVMVSDPRAKSKQRFKAATGAMLGGAFGLAAGGSGLAGAVAGADAFRGSPAVHDDGVECTLNEGETLQISVQPKNNGTVKIKILK